MKEYRILERRGRFYIQAHSEYVELLYLPFYLVLRWLKLIKPASKWITLDAYGSFKTLQEAKNYLIVLKEPDHIYT